MKKLMLLTLIMALPVANATASDLRMTVEQPHFTCAGHDSHFQHAAFMPGRQVDDLSDGSAPLPCCDGKIACAQFLSTNTIVRQATEWHG